MMKCPTCHSQNHADAPFCIECGALLSLNNAVEGEFVDFDQEVATNVPTVVRADANLAARWRSWAPVLGFALLLIVVVGSWLMPHEDKAEANYQQALAELKAQHWHRASELLNPLVHTNELAAEQYETALSKAVAWNAAYGQAETAARLGATAQAALLYRQAESIEAGYSDAAAKLTLMRQRNPLLVYRNDKGLFLATADGETLKQLPANGYGFEVLASSPDGKLVCYAYNSDYGKAQTRNLVVGDIARSFYTEQRFYFRSNFQLRPLDAAFISNGAGLLFVVGGKMGELATGDDPLELYYFDLVGNAGMQFIGNSHLVARPDIGDKFIYYVPDNASSEISSYALDQQLGATRKAADGKIIALTLATTSDNEPGLIYATAQDNHLHLYRQIFSHPDAKLLLDEVLLDTPTVALAASVKGDVALSLLGTDKAWLVHGDEASPLQALAQSSLDNITTVQFNPTGEFLLLINQSREGSDVTYILLDAADGKVLRRARGMPRAGSAGINYGWLDEGRQFYYYYHRTATYDTANCRTSKQQCSRDYIYFIDPTTTFANANRQLIEGVPTAPLAILPDGQSLLYTTAAGSYITTTYRAASISLFGGATGVWVLGKLGMLLDIIHPLD